MDETIPIIIAVEDALSEAVLRVMFEQSSRTYTVGNCLGRKGSGYLKKISSGLINRPKVYLFLC